MDRTPSDVLDESRGHAARRRVALAALIALAALALGIQLGRPSLWFDEADCIAWAQLPLAALGSELSGVHGSPRGPYLFPYYLVLRAWMQLFGSGESAVRALSLIAAVAALPLTYRLGNRLFGRRAATFAMVLVAANPLFYQLAREAHPYSLMVAFSVLSASAFWAALPSREPGRWAAYVVLTAVGIYLQIFVALLVLAQGCFVALFRRDRALNAFLPAACALAVLTAPLVLLALRAEPYDWLAPPTAKIALGTMIALVGGKLAFPVVLLVVAAAVYAARRRAPTITKNGEKYAFLLLCLFVPPVVAFAGSLVFRPMFQDTYLAGSIPAAALLVAGALVRLPLRRAAAAALLLIVVLCATTIARARPTREIQDWRRATADVLDRAEPNDAVVVYPFPGFVAYEYYRERRAPRGGPVSVPAPSFERLDRDRRADGNLVAALSSYRRVYVVLDVLGDDDPEHSARAAELERALGPRYAATRDARYAGLAVLTYVRRR